MRPTPRPSNLSRPAPARAAGERPVTTPLPIRIADPTDQAAASEVGQILADAFVDPVTCWLIPDDEDRRRLSPRMFGLFAEQALTAGTVYIAGEPGDGPAAGGQAAALWFDMVEPHPEPDEPDPRFDELLGPYTDRWHVLAETMDRHHPTDLKHHFLMLIGVRPGAQGHGIGSALLRAHHARVDELGLASYLDASSPRSRLLYLRHGYIDHGPAYHLGDDGPPMFPMLRPPGSS